MKINIDFKLASKDIFVGVMIAAVSIPISMGYAQIAGLPAIYGLYGSVLPIFLFAILTSSPQFIFGVDAAPAALIGGVLISLGIEAYSDKALEVVPLLAMYTAIWLFVFYIFKAGRLVNYISTPVMGGFITGIGATIILMQVPKLMGGTAGTGEVIELVEHIYHSFSDINYLSLIMGIVSLLIILISKKVCPKFPMSLVVMILGALATVIFHVEDYGVKLLPAVQSGLPSFVIPNFSAIGIKDGLMDSLPIAVVILAESLLSENNFAMKNNYKIDDNREILAYSMGNLGAALVGCCPVNGSVSRTAMGEQYGGKTKLVSIVAAITMMVILLCATGFIQYLPVPVLTAIVIAALSGILEIHLAKRLLKVNSKEFIIFIGAFLGVLLLGTINGVLIGVLLSFTATIIKSAVPPRAFLGIIPGRYGFYNINRNKDAQPLNHILIYRFSGSLFFANVNIFQRDIEEAIKEDTKVVIIDASGIGSLDITAVDVLESMYKNFKSKNIKFYITEHMGELNDEMRKLGIGYFVEQGVTRRTIVAALKDSAILPDNYIEEELIKNKNLAAIAKYIPSEEAMQEFEWAFGEDSEKQMEKLVEDVISHIDAIEELKPDTDIELHSDVWHHLGKYDEDRLLEHLERHLNEVAERLGQKADIVEVNIIKHRLKLAMQMREENSKRYERYKKKREEYEVILKQNNPELYNKVKEHRMKQYQKMQEIDPKFAEDIKRWMEE